VWPPFLFFSPNLWVVWPELLEWPPVKGVAHGLERLSLLPLVGGSLFLLFTGVLNIDYWYSPMGFYFPTAHFWTAWLVVGALVIHISAKTVTVRDELGRHKHKPSPGDNSPCEPETTTPNERVNEHV
jgi:hypothetical protein